jgi:hypothetical protein
MRAETVFSISCFLTLIGVVGLFGYLIFAEETVTVDVRVEDQRFRNVDDQIVMVSKVDDYTIERCNPNRAKDFVYVEDGHATFEFKSDKFGAESFEFCSPSRTGWMASATFEVDHLQSGIREYPTENLRFYVENVTVR